ncbi:hypothetical protein RhiirA1_486281 [Rhizophagus irregularis]|uniref:Uncharacterized protein n=1 Tax=Rhizophagus irregularis TaxID=588596 RepID=A0A2I1FRG2_9GLOM|nr:hypothetical protein RhiirA1_486281 [Rhizophagus irregularis]PKY36969.1 hypothetical protein RhiirB3_460896 [Rhizophagus irregularis]
MQNIKVHFEFFKSRSTSGKWNWTSLIGPDKKEILRKLFLSDQEIDAFEIDAKR